LETIFENLKEPDERIETTVGYEILEAIKQQYRFLSVLQKVRDYD